MEGNSEISIMTERLKHIINKTNPSENDQIRWLNQGEFIIVNLIYAEYFLGNIPET